MNIAECNILMELQRSGSTSQRAPWRGRWAILWGGEPLPKGPAPVIQMMAAAPRRRPRRNSGPGSRGRRLSLAAGAGMRMIPLNMEVSKGLLEVNGEVLIERLIRQLQEVGVSERFAVVGFMKEKYE